MGGTATIRVEAANGLLYISPGDVTEETFAPFRVEAETIDRSSCLEFSEEFRTADGWISY